MEHRRGLHLRNGGSYDGVTGSGLRAKEAGKGLGCSEEAGPMSSVLSADPFSAHLVEFCWQQVEYFPALLRAERARGHCLVDED